MSLTNERRHGHDLPIRDKDLITGRDARRIVRDQFEYERAPFRAEVHTLIRGAIEGERQRIASEAAAARAAKWYRRLWRKLAALTPDKAQLEVPVSGSPAREDRRDG